MGTWILVFRLCWFYRMEVRAIWNHTMLYCIFIGFILELALYDHESWSLRMRWFWYCLWLIVVMVMVIVDVVFFLVLVLVLELVIVLENLFEVVIVMVVVVAFEVMICFEWDVNNFRCLQQWIVDLQRSHWFFIIVQDICLQTLSIIVCMVLIFIEDIIVWKEILSEWY